MDKLSEALSHNSSLINDVSNHFSISNNLMGTLKNVESNIPENCRQNFYNNLESLRIVSGDKSYCSLNAPVVCFDEKSLFLADNQKFSSDYNFLDAFSEELYHELLHIASTYYVVDKETKKVHGYSGFLSIREDVIGSDSEFNGLTEGFTQYLTAANTGTQNSNYDVQIGCAKELVDKVGIDTVKSCYFNNKLGIQPIVDKCIELGIDLNYMYSLEDKCHVDQIQHFANSEEVVHDSVHTM